MLRSDRIVAWLSDLNPSLIKDDQARARVGFFKEYAGDPIDAWLNGKPQEPPPKADASGMEALMAFMAEQTRMMRSIVETAEQRRIDAEKANQQMLAAFTQQLQQNNYAVEMSRRTAELEYNRAQAAAHEAEQQRLRAEAEAATNRRFRGGIAQLPTPEQADRLPIDELYPYFGELVSIYNQYLGKDEQDVWRAIHRIGTHRVSWVNVRGRTVRFRPESYTHKGLSFVHARGDVIIVTSQVLTWRWAADQPGEGNDRLLHRLYRPVHAELVAGPIAGIIPDLGLGSIDIPFDEWDDDAVPEAPPRRRRRRTDGLDAANGYH
ncbi:hypothetical protein [Tautonia marina]|uniref:hypothetical protein n=1 Tax=Tautonia marina TaxID=2653855 RepID=UPI001260F9CE|nr:hypothetical protein [Tautonia marina]